MKKLSRIAAGITASAAFIALASGPSWASSTPPVHELAKVYSKCNDYIPVRQGVYDSSTGKGFGYVKIVGKHNIRSLKAMIAPLYSPNCGTPQAPYLVFYEYANELYRGEIVDEIRVVAVDNTSYEDKWYGVTLKGHVGLTTEYCTNYQGACPDWVTTALENSDASSAQSSGTTTSGYTYSSSFSQQSTLDSGTGAYSGSDDTGAADSGATTDLSQMAN